MLVAAQKLNVYVVFKCVQKLKYTLSPGSQSTWTYPSKNILNQTLIITVFSE